MPTPIFWLLVAFVVALLYFCVLLMDNIIEHGKGRAKRFWKAHIQDVYPYDDDM